MARRYYCNPLPPTGRTRLGASIAHHVGRVLRKPTGSEIVLFDGAGLEARATLTSVAADGIEAQIGEPYAAVREPPLRLELAVALPKGRRAEWLFEHATEVGVAAFRPIIAQRSATRSGDRTGRWRRIAAAASGQCDRTTAPEVHEPLPLPALLADPGLPQERYVADASGPPLAASVADRVILLVGPEGGFTDGERAACAEAGFLRRSLGPLTLRTETAALAGSVVLLHGAPAEGSPVMASHETPRQQS